jgi:hypothetical protein
MNSPIISIRRVLYAVHALPLWSLDREESKTAIRGNEE